MVLNKQRVSKGFGLMALHVVGQEESVTRRNRKSQLSQCGVQVLHESNQE
jgi:hypothetical protein